MKLAGGMVKLALEPENGADIFLPDSDLEEEILALGYVESIEASGASGYFVICAFAHLTEMRREAPELVNQVNRLIANNERRARCILDDCDRPAVGKDADAGLFSVYCKGHAWMDDPNDPGY